MGPSAPVIPADPVTSSLNLLEDRPEAAESDRLQLHFTEAAAAMMVCVVGDEGGGGGVVSGRRPTTNWLGVVLGEDDGGGGGEGGRRWRERPITNVSGTFDQPILRTDGRTDRQPASQEAEQLLESHPLPSRPTKNQNQQQQQQPTLTSGGNAQKKKSQTLFFCGCKHKRGKAGYRSACGPG